MSGWDYGRAWGYFCVECLVSEEELGRRLFARRCNRTKKIVGLICEHCNWERARTRDVSQEPEVEA